MKVVQGRPQPLGVTVTKECVNFAVCVPVGKECELLLYKKDEEKPVHTIPMPEEDAAGEVRFLALSKFSAGEYEYNYRIGGIVCIDPYVKEIVGSRVFGEVMVLGTHKIRGKIALPEYDWEGDRLLHIPDQDVVAYSLHVRGFTMHQTAKVKCRGTYSGIIEKLPYLNQLGINQIQCMPVYEFNENISNKINYWGYGEGLYFAPKATYSAANDAAAEFKDMVKACHQKGIEVVLEMPFVKNILPQTVLECLKYYMIEYHVDGFVVNPYHVPWDSLKKDPLLKGVKLLRKDDRFQNVMRCFLKGDEGKINDVMQVLALNTREDETFNYITHHTGFTLNDLFSYDGKHNEANGERNHDGPEYNFSWNCGAEGPSRKKDVIRLRKNQIRNAFFLLLTAQGVPCILAGDEFYNTQKGNNNVYCQDNELSWLNWSQLKKDESLFAFVKGLIEIRRQNPILHQKDKLKGADYTCCGIPDISYHGEEAWQVPSEIASRQLGVLYFGSNLNGQNCFIAYNMHWLSHLFALPNLPKKKKWYLVAGTAEGILAQPKLMENQKMLELPPRSIVFLTGR